GIPEAERERLVAGVAAQYESEVVYHQINDELERQGVVFLDTDTGLKEHEEMFREYFGSVIPVGDNKFSALTLRYGRVAHTSTFQRAYTSRFHCRPISGLTRKTWVNLSAP